jgi:hypothetical protein
MVAEKALVKFEMAVVEIFSFLFSPKRREIIL